MQHNLTDGAARSVCVSYAILPDQGEDDLVLRVDKSGALLCVADGCGGLGSKLYGERTGAYMAARLLTEAFAKAPRPPVPETAEAGRLLCEQYNRTLETLLHDYAKQHCQTEVRTRIVGSMQRLLPSTLCVLTAQPETDGRTACCYLWAGDSRGYYLDNGGLHQCTRDHARGNPDAFDSLYSDTPLSNLLSADRPVRLSARRISVQNPCILLCASDGAFGCLPTPMEFEMLLISTLIAANSAEKWQKRLHSAFAKHACDDATVLCLLCGFDTFEQARSYFTPRRDYLKRSYIKPVRRHGRDADFARECWRQYSADYDRTEGGRHETNDWRV